MEPKSVLNYLHLRVPEASSSTTADFLPSQTYQYRLPRAWMAAMVRICATVRTRVRPTGGRDRAARPVLLAWIPMAVVRWTQRAFGADLAEQQKPLQKFPRNPHARSLTLAMVFRNAAKPKMPVS